MSIQVIPQTLSWAKMPLAVYREVAAHLRQVSGVEVELLPQTALQFDYALSQVGGLRIHGKFPAEPDAQVKVLAILDYYCSRFGDWQTL
jgi:hypothetical protein